MLQYSGTKSIKQIMRTVIPAANSIALGMPIQAEIGPAIAKPSGLKSSEPIASKEEIRESASLGTDLCRAVGQTLAHKSSTTPHKNAQRAITSRDCGLAMEYM